MTSHLTHLFALGFIVATLCTHNLGRLSTGFGCLNKVVHFSKGDSSHLTRPFAILRLLLHPGTSTNAANPYLALIVEENYAFFISYILRPRTSCCLFVALLKPYAATVVGSPENILDPKHRFRISHILTQDLARLSCFCALSLQLRRGILRPKHCLTNKVVRLTLSIPHRDVSHRFTQLLFSLYPRASTTGANPSRFLHAKRSCAFLTRLTSPVYNV